jgi:hypothetical protein
MAALSFAQYRVTSAFLHTAHQPQRLMSCAIAIQARHSYSVDIT